MNVLQRRCLHTWPNIRPVTSALELASGALINGPNPPTSAQLIHLLESKATQVFGNLSIMPLYIHTVRSQCSTYTQS